MKSPPLALAITALVTIAILGTATLYAVRIVELFPLEHDVTPGNSYGDDWFVYHQYALSILNDGLSMPVVTQAYFRPAGFGYPYFVAAIYAIAGIRSEAVYLVQAIMLLAGIGWTFIVFRAHASRLAALAFLAALAVVLYLDVYRALTFRLLSENVLFIVWPALLFFGARGVSTGRHLYFFAAGIVCGIGFLMRPNLILVAPAIAAVVLRYASTRPYSWRARAAVIVIAGCLIVSSLMALRNYAVTGRASLTALTRTSDWWVTTQLNRTGLSVSQRAARMLRSIGSRAAYVVGIPYFWQPTFRLRPHWLAIWSGFFWYLWMRRRGTIPFFEVMVLALAFAYFAPILTLGYVSNYGVRNLAPGIPLILLLAVRGVDLAAARGREPDAEGLRAPA